MKSDKKYFVGKFKVLLPSGTETVEIRSKRKKGRNEFVAKAVASYGLIYSEYALPVKKIHSTVDEKITRLFKPITYGYAGDFQAEVLKALDYLTADRKARGELIAMSKAYFSIDSN